MSRARCLAAGLLLFGLLFSILAVAAPVEPPVLAGIPIDFLFALTLAGVALFIATRCRSRSVGWS